jgi:hypothetical protein
MPDPATAGDAVAYFSGIAPKAWLPHLSLGQF